MLDVQKKIINDCGFVMTNNDHRSIFKNLNKTINFYKYKKEEWKLLKKKSRLQIQKNFSISRMANTYMKNWIF
jgi:glycogen synthase